MAEKRYVVGVDIGGTNTVMGVVDAHGTIIGRDSLSTAAYPVIDDYVDALCAKLDTLMAAHGGKGQFRGIGVGAPNGNARQGTIVMAPNLPWHGIIPLADMIACRTGVPTALTNDGNAAAMGEMIYGVAHGMKDFVMITLGTGVGSGIVANGQLVLGNDGFAGELGHVCVDFSDNARPCGCGRRGCLEAYCSATGVARTAREILTESAMPSLLRQMPPEAITSKDVYAAAVKGDMLAEEIFRRTGRLLGRALAQFVAFSNPEAIILFGGLTKAGDYLLKPMGEAMDEYALHIYKGRTKLLFSALNDADAAVLGAASLGWGGATIQ